MAVAVSKYLVRDPKWKIFKVMIRIFNIVFLDTTWLVRERGRTHNSTDVSWTTSWLRKKMWRVKWKRERKCIFRNFRIFTHLESVLTFLLRPVAEFTFTAERAEALRVLDFASMMSFGQYVAWICHYDWDELSVNCKFISCFVPFLLCKLKTHHLKSLRKSLELLWASSLFPL